MALKGRAFVIMWHDITPQGDADYHQWHTRQHMPERLDHTGFLRSRRGVNRGLERQIYFTLYEGQDLASFVSEDYAHSLNAPTDWTRQIAPHFRNFLRVACEILFTSGRGVGGAVATVRLGLPPGMDETAAVTALAPACAAIGGLAQVTAVHLAGARPTWSDQETSETQLRPRMHEAPFDLVLVVEAIGLAEAVEAGPRILAHLARAGFPNGLFQPYDVAYTLEKRGAE